MIIDKSKLDKIVETLEEYTEYGVVGNHHCGYDVTPSIPHYFTDKVIEELNKILEE